MRHRLAAIVAVVALLPACVGHKPPPAAPAREQPTLELPPSPPPDGHGRVFLDVTDGPSVVHLVGGTSVGVSSGTIALAVHLRRLCATPCAVDLPYGQHELRFTVDGHARRGGAEVVDVQGDTTYLRIALGQKTGGGPIAIVGVLSTLFGSVGAVVGGTVWAVARTVASEDDDADVARTVTLVSLAVTVLGVAMWYLDRPTFQKSSSTQWR